MCCWPLEAVNKTKTSREGKTWWQGMIISDVAYHWWSGIKMGVWHFVAFKSMYTQPHGYRHLDFMKICITITFSFSFLSIMCFFKIGMLHVFSMMKPIQVFSTSISIETVQFLYFVPFYSFLTGHFMFEFPLIFSSVILHTIVTITSFFHFLFWHSSLYVSVAIIACISVFLVEWSIFPFGWLRDRTNHWYVIWLAQFVRKMVNCPCYEENSNCKVSCHACL